MATSIKRPAQPPRSNPPESPDGAMEQPASVGVLAEYMTTEELAAELKLNPWTVFRWRMQDKGPPVTRLGRRILYRRSSVQAWLAAQEKKRA